MYWIRNHSTTSISVTFNGIRKLIIWSSWHILGSEQVLLPKIGWTRCLWTTICFHPHYCTNPRIIIGRILFSTYVLTPQVIGSIFQNPLPTGMERKKWAKKQKSPFSQTTLQMATSLRRTFSTERFGSTLRYEMVLFNLFVWRNRGWEWFQSVYECCFFIAQDRTR